MSKKSLYLVDGSTLIFRAYFAIRHLSNSKGLPTNAVYGFTSMLRKLIRDHAPDYLVVVFDKSAQTFRNELYPAYKAHRPPAPEDLVPQFGLVRDVTKALNIHSLEMEGFEADDIIATLAKAYEGTLKTVIVSSDKDLMQLVTEDTSMLDTMKNIRYSAPEVVEKMGVEFGANGAPLAATWSASPRTRCSCSRYASAKAGRRPSPSPSTKARPSR